MRRDAAWSALTLAPGISVDVAGAATRFDGRVRRLGAGRGGTAA